MFSNQTNNKTENNTDLSLYNTCHEITKKKCLTRIKPFNKSPPRCKHPCAGLEDALC